MIEWSSHIDIGTGIDSVEKTRPDYLTIDWWHPIMMNDQEVWYGTTDVTHDDPMRM